jgi:hypothetical protein
MGYFWMMKFFRDHFFGRLLGIVTGIVFLNLSFILTEVNFFELKQKNSKLYEIIVKVVSGVGAEEEKDATGEKEASSEKEVNVFCLNQTLLSTDFYLITSGLHVTELNLKLLSGNSEIQTPPPKQA